LILSISFPSFTGMFLFFALVCKLGVTIFSTIGITWILFFVVLSDKILVELLWVESPLGKVESFFSLIFLKTFFKKDSFCGLNIGEILFKNINLSVSILPKSNFESGLFLSYSSWDINLSFTCSNPKWKKSKWHSIYKCFKFQEN